MTGQAAGIVTRAPVFRRGVVHAIVLLALAASCAPVTVPPAGSERERHHLARARVFLAAADYRRALEACQKEVEEAPSAGSYVYLTYAYHALNGYLDHLAKTEQWVKVEQLYVNLAFRDTDALTNPPEILARIAKEIIHESADRQADAAAAMAARLDEKTVARLWKQQAAWRAARLESWWAGVPPEWTW